MNKNEIKALNSLQSYNTCSNETIKKNSSYPKDSQLKLNKNNHKNKSISSNQIYSFGEESKSSFNNNKSKKKTKGKNIQRAKKRSKDRIVNLLKNNEKLKIPTGKRRSIAANNTKLKLNNINDVLKSLTPPKEIIIRTDKNGIAINKNNRKKVHITFLDDISPYNKITETVNIQSYKKYNVIEQLSNNQNNDKSNCSDCCIAF
jgi:hypothetical protein